MPNEIKTKLSVEGNDEALNAILKHYQLSEEALEGLTTAQKEAFVVQLGLTEKTIASVLGVKEATDSLSSAQKTSTSETEKAATAEAELARVSAEYRVEVEAQNKAYAEQEAAIKAAIEAKSQENKELLEHRDRIDAINEVADKWAQRIVAVVAAYVSFNAVKGFLTDAVQDAMKADDVWQTLHATLVVNDRDADKLGETLKKLGKETQELTRFTDTQVLAAGGVLSVFKSLSDETIPRVIELSKDIARQKGMSDLAGQAQLLGRALENPTHAARMLRMVGITLTESMQEQIKAFVKAGDVAKAQEIILDELEAKYTGLADTLGTTVSDRFEIVQHRFEDMRKEIGIELLPIVERSIPLFEAQAAALEMVLSGFDVGPLDGWNDSLSQMERNIISTTIALSSMGDIFILNSAIITKKLGEIGQGWVDLNEDGSEGAKTWGAFFDAIVQDAETKIAKVEDRLGGKQTQVEDRLKKDRADAEARRKEREGERVKAAEERDFRRGMGGMMDEFEALKELDPGKKAAAKAKRRADEKAEREEIKAEEKLEKEIAAREEKMRVAELEAVGGMKDKKKPPKEEKALQASFEGLTDLYRRISAAAATDTPEAKIEKAVIEAGKKEVEKLERIERALEPMKEIPPLLKEAMGERGLA